MYYKASALSSEETLTKDKKTAIKE